MLPPASPLMVAKESDVHVLVSTEAAYWLASQGRHVAHSLSLDGSPCLSTTKLPEGHAYRLGQQAEAPKIDEYKDKGHVVQAERPVVLPKVPLGHGLHAV